MYYLFLEGRLPGTIHQSQGQEATAVGVCWTLQERDMITSTHRPHSHAVARGIAVQSIMADLLPDYLNDGRSSLPCALPALSVHPVHELWVARRACLAFMKLRPSSRRTRLTSRTSDNSVQHRFGDPLFCNPMTSCWMGPTSASFGATPHSSMAERLVLTLSQMRSQGFRAGLSRSSAAFGSSRISSCSAFQ